MDFCDLRVKDIHSVVRHETDMMHWVTQNRINHIVGIKLGGSAFHDLGYQKFVMSENCVYFLNQKDDYKVKVLEPGPAFSIHFTTYEEIETDSFSIPVASPNKFISILQKAEMRLRTDVNLELISLLYQLCAELEYIRRKTYFKKDSRALAAKAYMDTYFKEKDCLKNAIAQSGITSRRFGDIFRENFDMTPNNYITFCKLEYAKSLLSSQLFSVSEVAEMSGFSDVCYFSKVFKKDVGLPPGKWTQK